jgi:6-phosphogluconolactonase
MKYLRFLLFWGLLLPVLMLCSCASPDSPQNGGGGGGGSGGGGGGGGKGSVGPGTTATYIVFSDGTKINVQSINTNGTLTAILGSPYTPGLSPSAIAVTPDGKFVYVLNAASNSITQYNIKADGTLTTIQADVQTGNQPSGIAMDPLERFLAVSNKTDGTVSLYGISSTSGALVPFSNSPIVVGNNPVAVTASSGFVYAVAPGSIGVIAVDPINLATSIPVGSPFTAGTVNALTAASAGIQLYALDTANNQVQNYTLNVSTGVPTFGSSIATGTQPVALLQVLNGKFLYVANQGSNNVSAYSIDGSGELTAVSGSPFTAGTGPSALAFDPVNNFLLVSNSGSADLSVFSVNTTSGALTSAASPTPLGGGVNSIAVGKP